MEIGIDDLDFMEDEYGNSNLNDTTTQDNDNLTLENDLLEGPEEGDTGSNDRSNPETEEDDFVLSLLKTRGIEDKSKIKFENEDGEIEEVNWDSLSTEDKLNILNSSGEDAETALDDSEIQLINAIRQSNLSPAEYMQALQRQSVDQYIQQTSNQLPTYKVNEISDDELFVMDLMSRTQDITEEEAFEALDRAKQNDTLFKKLIGAIRAEYQKNEDEALRYDEMRRQQEAQAQFDQFASSIENSIANFTEFSGYDLNMDQEDMQELYDFITGFDAAGNSHFGKALNDPGTLVRMAWFALNGEQMLRDIDEYYKKEIANVRKESYNKGLLEAKDKPNVIHKNIQPKSKSLNIYDDLDDI